VNRSIAARIAAVAGTTCLAALALAGPAGAATAAPSPAPGELVASAGWEHSYQVFHGQGWTPDRAKANALFNCRADHPYAQDACHILDAHIIP
jgi:hypothetical protein